MAWDYTLVVNEGVSKRDKRMRSGVPVFTADYECVEEQKTNVAIKITMKLLLQVSKSFLLG